MNNNETPRINHSSCSHESTPQARKICRAARDEKAERKALSVRPALTPITLEEMQQMRVEKETKERQLVAEKIRIRGLIRNTIAPTARQMEHLHAMMDAVNEELKNL